MIAQKDIINSFYSYLLSSCGYLVDNRIYEFIGDQDIELPIIVFTEIFDETVMNMVTDDSLVRMQVSIFGYAREGTDKLRDIADTVKSNLHRYSFTIDASNGDNIQIINVNNSNIQYKEDNISLVQEYVLHVFN